MSPFPPTSFKPPPQRTIEQLGHALQYKVLRIGRLSASCQVLSHPPRPLTYMKDSSRPFVPLSTFLVLYRTLPSVNGSHTFHISPCYPSDHSAGSKPFSMLESDFIEAVHLVTAQDVMYASCTIYQNQCSRDIIDGRDKNRIMQYNT